MNTPFRNLLLVAFVLLLSGCGASKTIAYFREAEQLGEQQIEASYDLRIKKDDMLSIIVNCKEPELAAPFNMQVMPTTFSGTGNISVQGMGGSPQAFLVDSNGEIDYPVFGAIHAEGMTRLQVADTIRALLVSNGYIQDPVVNVRLTNFKIAVMGEVARPGTLRVDSERITLYEALSQAGDLTIYGRRNNVKLIREEGGKRIVHAVNITDPALMNTPLYYLQQNDLVYIEPNNAKASQKNFSSLWSTIVSVLSLATTIGLYFAK